MRGESELANLIQEQGSTVGLFEPSLAPRHGTGKRALLVAEQLRVDQLGGDGAAVHAAERAAPERRMLMDRPGNDFLTRSCFSEQQHRRTAPSHHLRAANYGGQASLATDQPFLTAGWTATDQVLGQRSWPDARRP